MINILHLIWIIPLSMIFGAVAMICIACIIVGKKSEEEERRLLEATEECAL